MSSFFGRFSGQHEVQALLNKQASHLVRAAETLAKMVSADSKSRADLNVVLHEIENEADVASHQVLKEVGSRFVLPYDRGDLIHLTTEIDDCVDAIDEAGDNLVLYRIGEVSPKVHEITDIIVQCAEHAVVAVAKLKKLNRRSARNGSTSTTLRTAPMPCTANSSSICLPPIALRKNSSPPRSPSTRLKPRLIRLRSLPLRLSSSR